MSGSFKPPLEHRDEFVRSLDTPAHRPSLRQCVDHNPVGRVMNDRHLLKYLIPAIGTLHFAAALWLWCVFIIWVVDHLALATLPRDYLVSNIVIPLALCLMLLIGFVVSLHSVHHNGGYADQIGVVLLALTGVFFTVGASHTAAQIHYFGPPGTNHFYATWWLYSQFPPLSIVGRAFVAVAIFMAAILLLACCHRDPSSSRPTIGDLKSAGVDVDRG